MMATFEVTDLLPPRPSIWLISGLPMICRRYWSRRLSSLGRSSSKKKSPLEVPPRMIRQGIFSMYDVDI